MIQGSALFLSLIGLLAGASPAIAADDPRASAADDPIIAQVGDTPIHLSYVYRQIEALPLGDQLQYRENLSQFVESIIREEVLFQFALQHVLGEEPELREAVKAFVVKELVERRVRSQVRVSEDEIAAYYRDNTDAVRGEHWRVFHIPLRSRAECDSLAPKLTTAAAFEQAARKYGTVPGLAARSGDMGYFMRHHNVLGLGEILFKLPLETPFVFENQDGCHIIRVAEHVDPPPPAFDAIRPRLEGFLRSQRESQLLGDLVEKASSAVRVQRLTTIGPTRQ